MYADPRPPRSLRQLLIAGSQVSDLVSDLKECTAYLRAHPETRPEGNAAVYGSAATIPDEVQQASKQ